MRDEVAFTMPPLFVSGVILVIEICQTFAARAELATVSTRNN